jgi:hypothetical protein
MRIFKVTNRPHKPHPTMRIALVSVNKALELNLGCLQRCALKNEAQGGGQDMGATDMGNATNRDASTSFL